MTRLGSFWNFNEDFKNRIKIRDKELENTTPVSEKVSKIDNNKSKDKESPVQYVLEQKVRNIFDTQGSLQAYKFIPIVESQDLETVTHTTSLIESQSTSPTDNVVIELPEPKEIESDKNENKVNLYNLRLGDKLELTNGEIVYFVKVMSPDMIWVTPKESSRYDMNATGYTIFAPVGTFYNVVEDTSSDINSKLSSLVQGQVLFINDTKYFFIRKINNNLIVSTDLEKANVESLDLAQIFKITDIQKDIKFLDEDIVTGDSTSVSTRNLSDVMYQALLKWKKDGKVTDVIKVGKGKLVKMFPQFQNMLSPYDKSDSFVYDTPDTPSTGQKMILVNTGDKIINLSVNVSETNKWNAQSFYKLFSNNNSIM